MCDQISDAVLDAHLKQDPEAKVACGKWNANSYKMWKAISDEQNTHIFRNGRQNRNDPVVRRNY